MWQASIQIAKGTDYQIVSISKEEKIISVQPATYGSLWTGERTITLTVEPGEHGCAATATNHGPSILSDKRYFLIEHSEGLFCCQLGSGRRCGARAREHETLLRTSRVALTSGNEVGWRGGSRDPPGARIRPTGGSCRASAPVEAAPNIPRRQGERVAPQRPRHQAHIAAQSIGNEPQDCPYSEDDTYYISPSSLCDYELRDTAPRRIQTAITLCALYGLPIETLFEAMRINLEDIGIEPMPDQFVSRTSPVGLHKNSDENIDRGGFLKHLLERSEEVPFFLRQSTEFLSGLEDVSLNDFFWIGGKQDVLHPHLKNGLLAIVNRRRRRPVHFASKPLCQQPVYLLLKRDGTYLCCGIENGSLVVHPYSKDFYRAEVFRYHRDVEVVGQSVMIASKLV